MAVDTPHPSSDPALTSAQAAELLGARVEGDGRGVALWDPRDAESAPTGAVVVLEKLDADRWERLRSAGVAVVVSTPDSFATLPPHHGGDPARWAVAQPRLALARLSRRFNRRPAVAAGGVSERAIVDPTARLGAGVALAAGVVVGAGAQLGDGVVVGAGSVIGVGAQIGPDSELRERVVVGDGVIVGARCLIQAGAILGVDGFGYAIGSRGAERIHHLGTVVLGDDVDIGANSTIDRGTLRATRLGNRVKIGNLVVVAHNVEIGEDSMVAGLCALAGSSKLGARVLVGGTVGIADGVQVGDDARIAGGSGVAKNVPAGETWGGYPAQPMARWLRERYLIGRLEALWNAFKRRA